MFVCLPDYFIIMFVYQIILLLFLFILFLNELIYPVYFLNHHFCHFFFFLSSVMLIQFIIGPVVIFFIGNVVFIYSSGHKYFVFIVNITFQSF